MDEKSKSILSETYKKANNLKLGKRWKRKDLKILEDEKFKKHKKTNV